MRKNFCLVLTMAIALSLLANRAWSASAGVANCEQQFGRSREIDEWIALRIPLYAQQMKQNLSPENSFPGTVAASLSKKDPDYYYHWVRDAALTDNLLVQRYLNSRDRAEKAELKAQLLKSVELMRHLQALNPEGSLGEPKFHMNGNVFVDKWGRPQNDGPALRASTFTRLAQALLKEGDQAYVRSKLFDSNNLQQGIKADLEYIAHHWQDTDFDIWEEVRGHHFYNRMVQRSALLEGAALARALGDNAAADYYRRTALEIEAALAQHWNPEKKIIQVTVDKDPATQPEKNSGLDLSVILAVLHTYREGHLMSVMDERLLSTAHQLEESFRRIYAINQGLSHAAAIGRYPEDFFLGGNPWVLGTQAFAELHYQVALEMRSSRMLVITGENMMFYRSALKIRDPKVAETLQPGLVLNRGTDLFNLLNEALIEKGDDYLRIVKRTVSPDASTHEQFGRGNFEPIGAKDLTWNAVSFFTAIEVRGQLKPTK